MTKLITSINRVTAPTAINLELEGQLSLFLAYATLHKSPKTVTAYRSQLNGFIAHITLHNLTYLSPEDMAGHYRTHLKTKAKASTINLAMASINALYKYLHSIGVMKEITVKGVKNGVGSNSEYSKSSLTEYEVQKVVLYLDENVSKGVRGSARDRLLFVLGVSNGLRINELTNIKIEDIQSKSGRMVIYLLRKGYTDKSNFVILSPKTYAEVEKFIAGRTDGYLFQSLRGDGGVSVDAIGRSLRKTLIQSGVKVNGSISPHSIRHTYAQLVLKNGGDIYQLSKSLCHSSITVTERYLKSADLFEAPVADLINIV